MNNACPACGAIYNVTARDIGRRLKCKKCGAPMSITEAGIEPEGTPAPAFADLPESFPEPEPVVPRRGRERASSLSSGAGVLHLLQRVGGPSTLIFGFGAFLVIFHLFMPLIGDAKVKGRQAALDEERVRYEQNIEDLNKNKDLKESDKADRLKKLKEEYEADAKKSAQRVKDAELSNRQSAYLDRYFMMFGFLLVMAGSLAFMMPDQPPIRRVVGAVVITAQMVLVFIAFLGRSVSVG